MCFPDCPVLQKLLPELNEELAAPNKRHSVAWLQNDAYSNTHQEIFLCLFQQTYQPNPLPPGVHCKNDLSEGANI